MNARECDCPEWVERCVHVGTACYQTGAYYGGQFLSLVKIRNRRHTFHVAWDYEPNLCRGIYYGSNYALALAAFHEAEQRLLAGAL